MISSRVPLAVVSKTLRHSTLATTVNLYGHLLPQAARDAVTALGRALDHADRSGNGPAREGAQCRAVRPDRGRHPPSPCHHVCPERIQRACRHRQTRRSHRRDDRI
jgi:hypothetical protein